MHEVVTVNGFRAECPAGHLLATPDKESLTDRLTRAATGVQTDAAVFTRDECRELLDPIGEDRELSHRLERKKTTIANLKSKLDDIQKAARY